MSIWWAFADYTGIIGDLPEDLSKCENTADVQKLRNWALSYGEETKLSEKVSINSGLFYLLIIGDVKSAVTDFNNEKWFDAGKKMRSAWNKIA